MGQRLHLRGDNLVHNWKSVLLLEDEPMLAETLKVALKKLHIKNIAHASTIKEAEKLTSETQYDFFILDRTLPDGDGVSYCQTLRSKGHLQPILFLTARSETRDRVQGLNSGADDYLTKPFSWDELVARVTALHRRSQIQIKPTPEKTWAIDEQRLRIFSNKGWIELTPLEFKLASHLIKAQGNIVGREELLKEVWGFRFLPKTRTVDYFMGRLRKHFEKNPDEPQFFLTVRGAGYRFEKDKT